MPSLSTEENCELAPSSVYLMPTGWNDAVFLLALVMTDSTCTKSPRDTFSGVMEGWPYLRTRRVNSGLPVVSVSGRVTDSPEPSPVQKSTALANGFGVIEPRCL